MNQHLSLKNILQEWSFSLTVLRAQLVALHELCRKSAALLVAVVLWVPLDSA